ncbi:hypothetical protein BDP55DRAFT_626101 [Colletotrichum godetiae]|uniref:Uncharacterized protein n=1 Tax=Colletotrichum godetiae TaxID=1209918 RepID=A0AAJ0AYA8_9PEZI|nr:uncharacterized protein BDP55DRAFT_626101 [Colletotrichum godetiae]KAK1700536.1 hypothetical protein BDP55DRAFT_626101 [Colletotrichum godetiae]
MAVCETHQRHLYLRREALQQGAAMSHSLGSPANNESSLSVHLDSIVGQSYQNGPGGTLCDSTLSPSPSTAAQTTIPAWTTDVPVWNAPLRRIWSKMVLPFRNPGAALRRLPRRPLQALPVSNNQQWAHDLQPPARPTYLGGPKKRASLPDAPAGVQGGGKE